MSIIAIDFDGTVVEHRYPIVGKDVNDSVRVIKRLTDAGNLIILWTMRSNKELIDAVNWYKKNEIPLYGINYNPEQVEWTKSPKAYAHLYIDDAALGCPLVYGQSERPYVDWIEVEKILVKMKILT